MQLLPYPHSCLPIPNATLPTSTNSLTLARTHTLVPVYRTVAADLETPVSAFLRLAADEPECFLLESVEGGETHRPLYLHRHPPKSSAP